MIDTDRILAAAPMPLEMARRLNLRVARTGARFDRCKVSCPWHDDAQPSCSLAMRNGAIVAYCHACHEGGGLFALVAAVLRLDVRLDFRAVATATAELVGVVVDESGRRAPRPRDPRVELDRRVDAMADAWLRGKL